MKRFLKILAISVMLILILLIVLPFAFKGKIKEIALKEANKSLNAKLAIDDVSISLLRNFPNVYVALKQVRVTGSGDFESDTVLNLGKLSVSTGIFDLINGSPYEIKKIRLENADVRLKVLANGQTNWDIIKDSGNESEETVPASGENNIRFLLKSFQIIDSRLIYDDEPASTYVELNGVNHRLSGDLGAVLTRLVTQTEINRTFFRSGGIVYFRDTKINLQADLEADLLNSVYTFSDNQLLVNGFEIVFDGSIGLPEDGYDLDLTFSAPDNTFKKLLSLVPAVYTKEFSAVESDGQVGFNGFVKGKYTDDLYPAFGLNLEVNDAWFKYPDLPASVDQINIDAKIENPGGDFDNTVVNVKNLAMNLAGSPVRGTLFLTNPVSDPFIDTRIEANINLSDIQKFYPLNEGQTMSGHIQADVKLKGRLSALENERYEAFEASGYFRTSGIDYTTTYLAQVLQIEAAQLTIKPAYIDLEDLRAKAGRSDFKLNGKIENYLAYILKDGTLTGDFTLSSSLIDVNELLTSGKTGEDAPEDNTADISAFVVPGGLDISMRISASAVDYMDYNIKNFSGIIRIKDKKLILDDIYLNSMGGALQMNGSYASDDPLNPLIDLNLGLTDISIQETFRNLVMVEKFAPIAEKIIGNFSGKIRLAGVLDRQMKPRLETLNGDGNLATSSMQVSGVNTLNQLSNALKMEDLKQLSIAGAEIFFEFSKGSMEVKPFDFKAMGIDMNLGGVTGLDQQIAYLMKMKIPRSMMGASANNVINDLIGKAEQSGVAIDVGDYLNVDALIEGTLTDPKVKLDLAGMGSDIIESVKDQIKEQIEENVEQIKDQARELGENYLQVADEHAQAIMDEAQRTTDQILKNARELAEETKKQANATADKIVQESKDNGYVAELAAKKAAEEVRNQGDEQARNILDEAGKQSASILEKARLEAEKVKEEARKKAGL